MKKHMRPTAFFLMAVLFLSGCSHLKQLDTKTKILGAALATAVVVEGVGKDNGGIPHGLVSFGISHATEVFADQAFSAPEDEWIADTVSIFGAAIPVAYYAEQESGDTIDSTADYLIPVGNLIVTAWRRLSYEQHPVFSSPTVLPEDKAAIYRDKPVEADTDTSIIIH